MMIPLSLVTLIACAIYVAYYIKQQENKVNSKSSSNEPKSSDEVWELKNKLYEMQEKENGIAIIQRVFNCTIEECVEKYNFLKEIYFYYDFESAEDDSERISIYEKALNFYKDYQDLYLPYISEKGFNISLNTLGRLVEYFEDQIYNDIDYKEKLKIINTWYNSSVKINPNKQYLLDIVKEYEILPDAPNYKISSDNALKVASFFVDFFDLNVSEDELYKISRRNHSFHTEFSFLYENSFPEIFSSCVYYSFNLEGLSCTDYHFMGYIQDLFFGVVYYDLRDDWKSVVDNQYRTFVSTREDPYA